MNPLTISADRLQFLEDGRAFVWRGFIDYPIYGHYLTEPDDRRVAALMADRRSVGANTITCALMLDWSNMGALQLFDDRFFQRLRPFVDLAGNEGVRLELIAFTGVDSLMPDQATQLAHWERIGVTLGDKPNVSLMVSNQPGHAGNTRIDVGAFGKIPGFPAILCCRSNPNESENPPMPALDYSGYCSARTDVKGFIEVGSSMYYVVHGWGPGTAWDGTHQVSLLSEPWGAAETPRNNRRSDPGLFRQLGRSLCFRGTGGGKFLCDAGGSRSELLDATRPVQRACAIEFLGNIPHP